MKERRGQGREVGIALLFSGQGSQTIGMGTALAASCDDCRATFATADRVLGWSLSGVMAEGPTEELRRTAIAQPAVLTLAVAHARHLRALGLAPDALAGHSLGQYAALVVAGALTFEDAVRLVAARGELMQQTVPDEVGAMVAVVGLERRAVYVACEAARTHGVVDVACHNAPGQTVLSGERAAVKAAADRCEEAGGGIMPLPVSAPFHCALLAPMAPVFAALLEATPIADPALPVIDNVTARPLTDAAAVRRALSAQLTAPVLFEESLRFLVEAGTTRFVQCGPGEILLGFARRVARGVPGESFEAAALRIVAQ